MQVVLGLALPFCNRSTLLPICVENFRPAERSMVLTVLQAMVHFGSLTYLQTPICKLNADHELFRRQTRWSDSLQEFTSKWLFRPGKSSVADSLSRNPGTFAAVLPVAGSVSPCRCAALQCQRSNQQLIFKWTQSTNDSARPVSHLHWWCYDT